MASSFGNHIKITLFGESHGEQIGVMMDGLPAGITINQERINQFIQKRKAFGEYSTPRKEEDKVEFLSGVFHNKTSGSPVVAIIKNTSVRSQDYSLFKDIPRPSHADYTQQIKHRGYQDFRGGGHLSGRMTVGIVIAGAILSELLAQKNVQIASHIYQLHHRLDDSFQKENLNEQMQRLNDKSFATLNDAIETEMKQDIIYWKKQNDSIGGIIESVITGVDVGIGEPFFDGIESILSHLLFSIPGVKGVDFGLGFGFAYRLGSEANDAFIATKSVSTKTNNSGGINGGIANGMPIQLRTVFRPPASIGKEQETLNIRTKQMEKLIITGRHDPTFVHRARIVVDSMLAIGLSELYSQMVGQSWML